MHSKPCKTHPLFNCNEASLERRDPTYRASVDSDSQQIAADTVKDVLNFVDATTDEGTEVAEVAAEMKEGLAVGVGMEMEAKQGDPVVQMVRELNRVGHGIREQCKLITDLMYELKSLDCGQYVLEELTGLTSTCTKMDRSIVGSCICTKNTCATDRCSRASTSEDSSVDDASCPCT